MTLTKEETITEHIRGCGGPGLVRPQVKPEDIATAKAAPEEWEAIEKRARQVHGLPDRVIIALECRDGAIYQ